MKKKLLGSHIDFLKSEAILETLRLRHSEGQRTLMAYHNLHTLYMARRDADLAAFSNQADIVYADGMPIVMWGRLLGLPVDRNHRMTLSSWAPDVLRTFRDNHWRLFYLGATPEACEKGVPAFQCFAPGLQIEARDGFFNAEPGHTDGQALIRAISAFKPDVLMVGMGTPRQERWVQAHLDQLDVPIVWCVGAAIEYFAGTKARPPAFIGRIGMEWLYRLLSEPTRLWRRYLLEPIYLIPTMIDDLRRRRQKEF